MIHLSDCTGMEQNYETASSTITMVIILLLTVIQKKKNILNKDICLAIYYIFEVNPAYETSCFSGNPESGKFYRGWVQGLDEKKTFQCILFCNIPHKVFPWLHLSSRERWGPEAAWRPVITWRRWGFPSGGHTSRHAGAEGRSERAH